MLGFSERDMKLLIMESVIAGIVWAIIFYFVRKGLNRRNFEEDPEKKKTSFWYDAVFGGIGAFTARIVKQITFSKLRTMV